MLFEYQNRSEHVLDWYLFDFVIVFQKRGNTLLQIVIGEDILSRTEQPLRLRLFFRNKFYNSNRAELSIELSDVVERKVVPDA